MAAPTRRGASAPFARRKLDCSVPHSAFGLDNGERRFNGKKSSTQFARSQFAREDLLRVIDKILRHLAVVAMEVVRPRLGCEVAVTTHATVTQEPRMDIHENARTTPRSRMLIVERLEAGSTVAAVASAFGVDGRTVRKWRDRFRVEGAAGLGDRSSRPHSCPFRLDAAAETEIAALRRQRLSGPAIARRLGRPVSTVGKALRRIGLGRLKALDPALAVVRYEWEQPAN